MECTGLFRDRDNADQHLSAGARKVIISAPAGDPDITIVMGVNSSQYDPRQAPHHFQRLLYHQLSGACGKVLLENFGIRNELMTTIHSYVIDNMVKVLGSANKEKYNDCNQ